jgi:hypothetical protein
VPDRGEVSQGPFSSSRDSSTRGRRTKWKSITFHWSRHARRVVFSAIVANAVVCRFVEALFPARSAQFHVMPKGGYASRIAGLRLLGQRELPPVSTCWDFQTSQAFSRDSATFLFSDLPEDCQISFFDPEAEHEEAWIFVRRLGERYFAQRVRHGSFSSWKQQPFATVLTSFASSPLVQRPSVSIPSFTVSSIPDHQRHAHINEKA